MYLPRLVLNEQESLVHGTEFSSKTRVKITEATEKYLTITDKSTTCQPLNK
jgi:hypothetical protein